MRAFWYVAGGVGALALGAGAESSVVYTYAETTATAQASSVFDSDVDSLMSPADPFGLDAAASAASGSGSFAAQSGTASSLAVSGAMITGSASMDAQWASLFGDSIVAFGVVEVVVEFSLAEAAGFLLSGDWVVDGPYIIPQLFFIEDLNTSTTLYTFGHEGPHASPFQYSGSLAAGDYRFSMTMNTPFSHVGEGSIIASVDYVFVIPAPGAGAALAMLGLAGLRRRRG